MLLLAFQIVPVLSAGALKSGAASPAPQGRSAASPQVTPDYILLGELKGSALVQSQRPHSVPLLEGHQFAATYYTAKDFQDAYGSTSLFSSGYNGRGETIAIIDAYGDPTIVQDVAAFDREFKLPAANLTVIPVGPYEPSLGITYGWDAETALDVEAAHTMAPYAHINLLVGANSSNALYTAVKMVVDDHLGNVVSMSWGLGENSYGESGFSAAGFLNYAYVDYYFQKGSAEGITFFASTGDLGAFDGTTTVTADYPSTSPFVTGVGGTALFLTPTSGLVSALNTSATYAGEEAWSVSPQYAGQQVSSGGGVSALFPQPYYQAGATTSPARTAPDVAADADPYTGMVIVLEGGNYVIGGTSLSSPLWAGMAADLDQYTGKHLGLLNPYLYSIYANSTAYDSAFHQVSYGFNGAYQAGPGYNLVTGLGSPNLPQLAADLKSQSRGLEITVKTDQGSSSSAPAQYSYGDTITVSATALTPQGAPATTGSFTAKVESVAGTVDTVPLSYNGSSWVGTHTVGPGDPPGSWSVAVSGTSAGFSGKGIADVDVGASLGILSPVPYPFGPTLPPGVPFQILVSAQAPNGSAITSATLTAHLIHDGKVVSDVPLPPVGGGYYVAMANISSAQPQGTYTLVVNGTALGSVYSYFYIGEAVTGVMILPNNDAIPSASAGQQVVLLARTVTSAGTGAFTSNATADVYSLSGTLMASVKLQPAPNTVQFGVFNFFNYQQANFTIPANLTQGFYRLEFLSSLAGNKTTGTQLGNFTTGFYVSGPTLSYTTSQPEAVFAGQGIQILAKITDSTGAPVTTGDFLATAIPTGYAYEAYVSDFDGYTGVPLQYNPAIGEWEGVYLVPSALTSPNAFLGNVLGLSSGAWTVFVSGESASASNVVPASSYVNVLPYTYYGLGSLSPSNIATAPLVTSNSTGYTLADAGAGSLAITGLSITLSGDSIGSLTLVNSNVRLDDSQVGDLTVTNSTVTVVDSTYKVVSPALPAIAVTGLQQPLSGNSTITITVSGEQLSSSSIVATVDGAALPLKVTASASGLTATASVDATSLADGVHTLAVRATQSDSLSSSVSVPFSTDAKASSLSGEATGLVALSAVLAVVAVVALVLAVAALRRKAPAPMAGPKEPPQV
jgi:subtilase family serine protease